jgi:hypothetical protein
MYFAMPLIADNLAEKELKGVASVGLLGTLEEVGFNIRHPVGKEGPRGGAGGCGVCW